ncbi:MAG: bifunctional ornithine acetyltransferase/N-acetylglutamate synthase [Cyanothece sp. SIO2G6]|nr:bifunctional ornithine acetyltransferase/N-acetylglutamate synthase [Cyanothece sp. SIO2G6]
MAEWQVVAGGVTAPKGYRAAGIAAGLKSSGAADLALIVSDVDAIASGVFTTSHVKAACVDYCLERLDEKSSARAILCNAGQANACTGTQGRQDVDTSIEAVAQALGLVPELVLVASTGVIGKPIKMDALLTGIPRLVASLAPDGGDAAAEAIGTTDLVPKFIALETLVDGRPVRIGGMAKGSGMIHPNMATMLAFITCDAAISSSLWHDMLQSAVNQSFNQITVDGDTSTNDTVIALANGESRTPAITKPGAAADQLEAMLTGVCQYLAKAIARDGEGATCLIEVKVTGTATDGDARQVARTVAGSSLVKAAVFGRDPNWGRIAAAAGRAGVPFDANVLDISLGSFTLMQQGQPLAYDKAAASGYLKAAAAGEYLKEDTVLLQIKIGNGPGSGTAWGCDLSYDYVKINAEYTT